MGIRAVGRNAVRPGYLRVMADKVVSRVAERGARDSARAQSWAQAHAEAAPLGQSIDAALWTETQAFAGRLRARARRTLSEVEVEDGLGGGGHWPLLRFLVRHSRPSVVVETGVAAGWSSAAILDGLAVNDHGELWSSDFPYFRIPDPERYVGILVDDEVRDRWHLYTRGDRSNLPTILKSCGQVDLFHYDSDKSYRGRTFATGLVVDQLSRDGIVILDDVDDNMHFADLVTWTTWSFIVLPFGGKFVGVTGPGAAEMLDALPYGHTTPLRSPGP